MVLDAAGLGLSLVSKLTRTAKSIQEHYESYRESPVHFGKVDATLTRLTGIADSIDEILRGNPETMPHAVLPDFVGTLTNAKDTRMQYPRIALGRSLKAATVVAFKKL